uniref:COX assembly mitochondrial protein n=1 Tax=Ditylum brightwellii TaxID=49249 RepID=A0A6U3Q7B0_9STRA|mmetsp:Transcript_32827/g.43771  ORF Transcript_32827/g.43771 Transcript_32827/m.43771 type:complete len:109 (+) Transcript_32827:67-393(+)|eukprot:8328857-Ditylum_brightwellii.AAC.1
MAPKEDVAEDRAKTKDYSRESRLSFRKFAEHQMRREFKEEAIEKCRPHIMEFGKCAEESGLMVVFKCRQFSKDLNSCMAVHNSNEAWEKYKEEHKSELEKRTIKSPNA